MKSLDGTGQKRLHRAWRRRTEGAVSLVLDSVQNPFNVGSILRTAAAFRVDHIWLAGTTEPVSHPKTKKTALGAERYLTFSTAPTGEAAVGEAHAQGYQVIGIELADSAVPLHEVATTDRVCLVLGHEERGLTPACMAACDAVAFIPMLGKIGSLNVATAAAIGLYEVRRHAWTAPERR
jgi:tRNA (guanosine-2'-O-)-methyltransferase